MAHKVNKRYSFPFHQPETVAINWQN